jgi:peroxiredoxin
LGLFCKKLLLAGAGTSRGNAGLPSMTKFVPLFILAGLLLAPPLLMAYSLPASAGEAKPLGVGAVAPSITLGGIDGPPVDLGKAFAEKPTVLVFYRGSWCPFCNRQLAALAELEPKLLALGYQIIAVSPDTAEGLKKMAGTNHLDYRLLSDHDMAASKAYGTAFRLSPAIEEKYRSFGVPLNPIPGDEGHWLPVPTVYLIGRDGLIKFAYSNPDYSVRLSSDALLAAAEATAK